MRGGALQILHTQNLPTPSTTARCVFAPLESCALNLFPDGGNAKQRKIARIVPHCLIKYPESSTP